ncbi:hypothetical protein M9H77_10513 [Catharanthus roseus]|uniref:Uncharacterized protein n=1 Tax=Catharanthus roseus TaxID=4058 RepID=A0ACC0BC06_CATRO|nr:hypothetical protein M9H77_10513 [Catharanthus roseus]
MVLMKQQQECGEDDAIVEKSPDGRFLRYDEVLGTGAFKVLYKGFDQENRVEVSWYQISIDDAALDSPELEESLSSVTDLLKSLKHDNIIKYNCSWVDNVNRNINLIMDFFSSRTLRHYSKNHKYVDIKSIKRWGRQILEGLNYLHSKNPPIIHRDLRCDNIFVNGSGNLVEVKIGDLGLATIINEATAKSVLGSPEFMAPELYDDEHNELVDIYSFGMCMLELITSEYPYKECKNQAHVFKEVTAGIKPLSLEKVKVPEIKKLIEKCLAPVSQRFSAAELLNHPFFLVEKSKDSPVPQVLNFGLSNGSMENLPCAAVTLESSMSTEEIKISLKGKRIDVKSISFDLRIAYTRSPVANKFEFPFDLEADDALQIAVELVREKNLSFRHLPLVVELMDAMLLELAPGWNPCY